jgi:hypothetical protein
MIKKYLEFIKESKEDIDSICKRYNIQNYTINDDGSINVDGNVDLSYRELTKLPLKFRHVGSDFYCNINQLTSLEGAPQTVGGGYFDCSDNQLTNLEGAPKTVGGDFNCSNNQLTSLEGCPKTVGGVFYCNNNQLTSLEGCPKTVGGDFDCDNNKLISLEGSSTIVGGYFSCNYNQLTSLEGCPKTVGGVFYCNNNQLTSLEGSPKTVGDSFYCHNNQLTSLEGGPSYVKDDFVCSNNPLLVRLTNDILDIGGGFYLTNTPLEVLWNDVLKVDKKFLDYLNTQTWDNVFPAPKTVYEDYFLEGVEENNIGIPDNWRELLEKDGWTII